MNSSPDLRLRARAEIERRRRLRIEEEGPRYDWYGEPCDCPPDRRKPNGSCPEHPRARPNQRPPEAPWHIWYLQMGRGTGKTRSGAEWVRHRVETKRPGRRIALIAPTAADVRDVMIEGESGILAICPPWNKPRYEPSKRRVVWPNGSMAVAYSADEPERLRGPQHHDAWLDEPAAFRLPAVFDMMMFGLRLGDDPRVCMTTTPKPHKWLREIKARLGTIVSFGSSFENRDNLAPSFFDEITKKYQGTRLGRQELEAEDLEDTPGALWTSLGLDECRIDAKAVPDLTRIVVGVDPSAADPDADPDTDTAECGIMVGGMAELPHPALGDAIHGYLLADHSLKAHPRVWGQQIVNAYHDHKADLVVAEANNGGAMVATVIQSIDPNVPVKLVHASRGKVTRAEPIASYYQQGRVKHVRPGDFAALELQMTEWVPGLKSPDRLDAMVWTFTELFEGGVPLVVGGNPFPGFRG